MSLNAIFDPMVRSYFDDDGSGGGLPVVELETEIDGAGNASWETAMVESDWTKLSAVESMDTPIIIKFVSFDFVENVCLNKLVVPSVTSMYYGIIIDSESVFQMLTLTHMPGSDAWMAQTKRVSLA